MKKNGILKNVAQIYDSRCRVSFLDFLMPLKFSEMKIQRLATNRKEPFVYSGNKTAHEFEKDWVRIELPPEVLKGKG